MVQFNLSYDSPKHNKIRDALRARVKLSEDAIGKKESDYEKDEDLFQIYLPETTADALRRTKRESGKPQLTTLVIPYSYATLMTAHTYWASVYLARSPVMQFMARHGETRMNVQAVEALLEYQVNVGENLAPLYIWLLDPGMYGIGVLGCYWHDEYTMVSEIVEKPETYFGIEIAGKTKKVRQSRKIKGYSGNKLYNIRVYDFLHDPRVSLLCFQDGEYAGRKADIGWNQIVKRKMMGIYQNVDVLEKKVKAPRGRGDTRSRGADRTDLPFDATENTHTGEFAEMLQPERVSIVEMCVELIPKMWELGTSEEPEKWVFTLAEDEVIIEAQPYSYYHGKFPYQVLHYDFEGYGINKRSMLELTKPLNDAMDWLMNTHLFNVRAVLNGTFLLDPSRVTLKDLSTDKPGRLVRLKPTAYGQDVRTMLTQFTTVDVTQNHIRDTQVLGDMIQRVTGVTDNIMGMVNQGGRKTATEVRTSTGFGANRLKTQAEFFSATGFAPLAQMMLQNTQQHYDDVQTFRIAGDLLTPGQGTVMVDPEMIMGFYDFIPVDGTMPIDRFAQVNMWNNLLAQLRNYPQIMMQYDMGGIFSWIAKLGGLKNVEQFKVQVMPDQMAAMQAQAGNLIPMGGGRGKPGGPAQGRTVGPGAGNAGPVQGPGQIPGMGPSG